MSEVPKAATVRAFLAVDPPVEVRNGIAAIQDRLKKQFGGSVRWVRPDGIHLTLKFFGDISLSAVETISGVVKENARGINPMSLLVRKIGAFPNPNRPRVLWLGIDGDVNQLIALQNKIDTDLHAYGFEQEDHSFSPHLTLGRVKTPQGLTGLAKMTEEVDNYSAGEFRAEELVLFKSDLRQDGGVYTKLGVFPFC